MFVLWMRTLLQHHIHQVIIGLLGILVYIYSSTQLQLPINEEVMFYTPDAKSYQDVALWLKGGGLTESVGMRPLLYPLLILTSSFLGGVKAIWLVQFIFWWLSLIFIFNAIKQSTQKYVLAYLGTLVMMCNLSLIALTYHGLTEVSTVFVTSYFIWWLTHEKDHINTLSFIHRFVLFLVILTLIKPVFAIPLLGVVIFVIPLFYRRKYFNHPKKIWMLLMILLPILVQIAIVKINFNQTKVSIIGQKTMTEYLVAQGIQKIEQIDRATAIEKSKSLSSSEQMEYLKTHSTVYFDCFLDNVETNIKGTPTYLLYPEHYANIPLSEFMLDYNEKSLFVHQIFVWIVLVALVILLMIGERIDFLVLLITFSIGAYYILATGISFFQGDRLTLPAITFGVFTYTVATNHLIDQITKLIHQRKFAKSSTVQKA